MSTVRLQEDSPATAEDGTQESIDQAAVFKQICDDLDADLFIYSGGITR